MREYTRPALSHHVLSSSRQGVFHLGRLSELTGEVLGFLLLGSLFNNVISDYLWAR